MAITISKKASVVFTEFQADKVKNAQVIIHETCADQRRRMQLNSYVWTIRSQYDTQVYSH